MQKTEGCSEPIPPSALILQDQEDTGFDVGSLHRGPWVSL